jgi:hypothetical protein
MEPVDFETFVKSIIRDQLSDSNIQIHHRRRLRGKRSGYSHEIDLSFEIDLVGTQVLVIVECKAYQRPVSVDDVLEFCSRIDDIGAHKGILVSTRGFTDGAIRLAESKNVAMIQAHVGLWHIIGRYTGSPPPQWSDTFFYLAKASITDGDDAPLLKLDPVNQVDMAAVCVLGEAVRHALEEDRTRPPGLRSLRVVFKVVLSGGSVPGPSLVNLWHGTSATEQNL